MARPARPRAQLDRPGGSPANCRAWRRHDQASAPCPLAAKAPRLAGWPSTPPPPRRYAAPAEPAAPGDRRSWRLDFTHLHQRAIAQGRNQLSHIEQALLRSDVELGDHLRDDGVYGARLLHQLPHPGPHGVQPVVDALVEVEHPRLASDFAGYLAISHHDDGARRG